jgi:hypothetical protein
MGGSNIFAVAEREQDLKNITDLGYSGVINSYLQNKEDGKRR